MSRVLTGALIPPLPTALSWIWWLIVVGSYLLCHKIYKRNNNWDFLLHIHYWWNIESISQKSKHAIFTYCVFLDVGLDPPRRFCYYEMTFVWLQKSLLLDRIINYANIFTAHRVFKYFVFDILRWPMRQARLRVLSFWCYC